MRALSRSGASSHHDELLSEITVDLALLHFGFFAERERAGEGGRERERERESR